MDGYRKWPIKSLTVPLTSMVGGYAGSVLAGAMFVSGGGLPIIGGTLVSTAVAGVGAFVGAWVAVQMDRSPFMMKLRLRRTSGA